MFKTIYQHLKNIGAKIFRPIRNKLARKKYKRLGGGEEISIMSQNCIGGVMYHDLGLKFCSPTINCYMSAEDYVQFCEKLDYYLSLDAKHIKFVEERNYPVGFLDNIKIYFVHYTTKDEVIRKWNDRKLRVNKDKICLIMTDRDGFNEQLKERFLKLPYKKIVYSSKQYIENEIIYMPCFKKFDSVGTLTNWCNIFGKRFYSKGFDYIKYLADM